MSGGRAPWGRVGLAVMASVFSLAIPAATLAHDPHIRSFDPADPEIGQHGLEKG